MKTDEQIARLTLNKLNESEGVLAWEVESHLRYMISEIIEMKDTRKANRWLGFIHGQLVALTDCTIDELRDICR